jgi:hypothetical protein
MLPVLTESGHGAFVSIFETHANGTADNTSTSAFMDTDSFSSTELAFAWWMTLSCTVGAILSARSVWTEVHSTFGAQSGYVKTVLVFIFCTDTLWMSTTALLFWIQAIQGSFLWTVSCPYIPFSSVLFASGSCMSMAYLAVERYRMVVKEQRVAKGTMLKAMTVIWCHAALMGTFPLWNLNNGHVNRSPARVFCMNQWYINTPTMRAHSAICVLSLCTSLCCTIYCYVSIYSKYKYVTLQVRMISSSDTLQQADQEERAVIHKLVGIVIGFTGCWILYFFVMMIQLATHEPSPAVFEGIATWLVFSTPTCNAWIFAKAPEASPVPSPPPPPAPHLVIAPARRISSPSMSMPSPTMTSADPSRDRHHHFIRVASSPTSSSGPSGPSTPLSTMASTASALLPLTTSSSLVRTSQTGPKERHAIDGAAASDPSTLYQTSFTRRSNQIPASTVRLAPT